jgi:hypothetical protein
MGVDAGNSMTKSSTWTCLLMKIIRLVMEPCLISRYHPKTNGGVGNYWGISQLGDLQSYGSYVGSPHLCTSFPLGNVTC